MNSTETMDSKQDIIDARDLTMAFGEQVAVQSLNMRIPSGTIFGFIGPSGCGKTTTLRLLTGVLKPTSGELKVLGKDPTKFTKLDREKMGYLIQQFVLYPELTVWENLNFAASIYGVGLARRARMKWLLDFVDLSEHKKKLARALSGGMQKRLALAATLVHNPELLFLDEPTAGIDPILRRKFWENFKAMQAEGRTLFITTQYVSEAAYCDLVGVMSAGKLLIIDTPDGLRKHAYGGEIVVIKTKEWIDFEHRKKLESLPFIRGKVRTFGDQEIELIVDEANTAIPALIEFFQTEGLRVETIEEKSPPFDDVFVKLIEAEAANV